MPGLRVRWLLDGLWFNTGPDTTGCEYWITAEKGWSGSPPVRADHAERPFTHGTYPTLVLHGGRVIELSGTVHAPTWEARRAAEHRLAALCSDPQAVFPLVCTEETSDLTTLVQRSDTTLVAIRPGGMAADFTLQLHAPDPRKYAAVEQLAETGLPNDGLGLDFETGGTNGGLSFEIGGTTGGLDFGTTASLGRAIVTNTGTAPTLPAFTLVGPLTAPITIARPDSGARLVFNDSLASGDRLVIDTNNRTVLLGGATNRRHRAVITDWDALTIPAAATIGYTLTHTAPANTVGRLQVRWRSAWW